MNPALKEALASLGRTLCLVVLLPGFVVLVALLMGFIFGEKG